MSPRRSKNQYPKKPNSRFPGFRESVALIANLAQIIQLGIQLYLPLPVFTGIIFVALEWLQRSSFGIDYSLLEVFIICVLVYYAEHARRLIYESREKEGIHVYGSFSIDLVFRKTSLLVPLIILFILLYRFDYRANGEIKHARILTLISVISFFLLLELRIFLDLKNFRSKQISEWNDNETLNRTWTHRIRVKLNSEGMVDTKSFPKISLKGSELHRQTNWAIDRYFEQNEIDEKLSITKERRKIFFVNFVLKREINK